MSSHPYVTQQNTPLADDTTLMSTTDLQSYITHANDTFVQVSGFTLQDYKGSRTTWCVTRICQKRRLRICGSP
ncbi:aerotaxis receptor protein [Escherichia coli]|uniref:Aerotaxis receptor protein n=1 Tax=Escherichia coli TaxID=562 RepID=A0A376NWL1_ECOLX|nr:aerotaxis receptor protein [Escherichia coli]